MKTEKDSPQLAAISLVAAGYAGDMPEVLANELFDDMDFDRYGKLKCCYRAVDAAADEDGGERDEGNEKLIVAMLSQQT